MKKLVLAVMMINGLLLSSLSLAGFWTGETLITKLVRCDNFSGVSATECSEGMGYLKGVDDALGATAGKSECGIQIKYSQLERATVKWLKAHQDRWEEPAEVLVVAAIDEEWPCARIISTQE